MTKVTGLQKKKKKKKKRNWKKNAWLGLENACGDDKGT